MAIEFVAPDDTVILDACCLINLLATPAPDAIFESFSGRIAVAAYVLEDEITKLDVEPFRSGAQVLHRLIAGGDVVVAILESAAERKMLIELAGIHRLDDGEAMTAAIALARGWIVASDDRKVHTVLPQFAAARTVLTTPDIIKLWADSRMLPPDVLATILAAIERDARYQPPRRHPLHAWWQASRSIA